MSTSLILEKIKILSDDYNEVLISKNHHTNKFNYQEQTLSERVINGYKYNNIYVLDPNRVYQCYVSNDQAFDKNFLYQVVLIKDLINAGIILLEADLINNTIYIKNHGGNPVYIEKKAIIANYNLLDKKKV